MFTATTLSQSSSERSTAGRRIAIPALLTRMSTRPSRSAAAANSASTESSRVDVGGVRPGAAAERDNFRDRLGGGLGVEVRDDRYGARVGQRQRGRATDPARAAGHDGDGAVHSRGARSAQPSFDPRAVTYIE